MQIGQKDADDERDVKVEARRFASLDDYLELFEVGLNLLAPIELEIEDCLGEPEDVVVFRPDGSISYGLDELV